MDQEVPKVVEVRFCGNASIVNSSPSSWLAPVIEGKNVNTDYVAALSASDSTMSSSFPSSPHSSSIRSSSKNILCIGY